VPRNLLKEKELASRYLFFLLGSSVLVISPRLNFDAINVPKITFIEIGLTLIWFRFGKLLKPKPEINILGVLAILILIYSLGTTYFDQQSFMDAMVGNYGRLFGIATLSILLIIYYLTVSLRASDSIFYLSKYNLLTSLVLQFYLLLQFFGIDAVLWDNVYPSPPGTLGNPNFVAAYIAFSFFISLPFFGSIVSAKKRFASTGAFLILSVINIQLSNSFQGFVSLGIGLAVLFLLNARKFNRIVWISAVFFAGVSMFFGSMGIFGYGPLKSILYSYTIDLRVSYWRYGFEMLEGNWIFGLGFDSYDDFYRAFMSPESVFTNSPHNFVLDLLVGGGVLLTIPVLLLILWGPFKCILEITRQQSSIHSRKNQIILVASFTVLITQSIINPFQISLIVWLFLCSGLCFSASETFVKDEAPKLSTKIKTRYVSRIQYLLPVMNILTFGIVSILYFSDYSARKSIETRELTRIINMSRMPISAYALSGVKILHQNNYVQESYSAAKEIVRKNPNNVEALNYLLELAESDQEKRVIEKQLNKLDPFSKVKEPNG